MMIELSLALSSATAIRLNPYSNGMMIERTAERRCRSALSSLNPYSNGMMIELSITKLANNAFWS